MNKLVRDSFIKTKIQHISGSTVQNVMIFFTACPIRVLPKYNKAKVLSNCFYLI